MLAFWVPMAFTWLMMALEGPFLAALIARLAEPKENLAAFGVAFAVAIILESPVIMILSASTALIGGRESFRRLRRFTYTLNAAVTVTMLLLLLTPAFPFLALHALRLPEHVAGLTHTALLMLIFWPAAVGYRRFYQGILIRGGETRRVAYGTVIRLSSMALVGIVLARYTAWPGAWVGGAALAGGVLAEAVITRWMARHAVRRVREIDEPADVAHPDGLTQRAIGQFYFPLALTSFIGLAAHPIVTFFMALGRAPLESLAVLPVINSLTFLFRSVGLSYQEVAIALLGHGKQNRRPVTRFALVLALGASAGLALIAFTPLRQVWFEGLSGLTVELAGFATTPIRILALMPALSVLLSLQRAILVDRRRTAAITWATAGEVLGIVAILLITVLGLGMIGATGAALAMVGGRLVANVTLLRPCFERD